MTPHRAVRIAAVIATRDRPLWAERCLRSLAVAAERSRASVRLSVGVCVAGPDAETERAVERVRAANPGLDWQLARSGVPLAPGAARNRLLPARDADWVLFLDDDAYVDADFLVRAARVLAGLSVEVAAVGGPNLTPPASSWPARALGAALASRLATYHSHARYRRGPDRDDCGEESLMLCNLLVRSECVDANAFDPRLPCGEENLLLEGLRRRGRRLAYRSALEVRHERRSGWGAAFAQMHRYGRVRADSMRRRRLPRRVVYFAPSAAVLTAFGLALTSVAALPAVRTALSAALAVYLAAALASGEAARRRAGERLSLLPAVMAAFLLVHLAYGTGFLAGWWSRSFVPPGEVDDAGA